MTIDEERGKKPDEIALHADTEPKTVIEDVFDAHGEPETIADEPSAKDDLTGDENMKTPVGPSPDAEEALAEQDAEPIIAELDEVQEADSKNQQTVVDQLAFEVAPDVEQDKDGFQVSPRMAAGAAAGVGIGAAGGAYVASEAVDQLRDRGNEDAASGVATESLDVFDVEMNATPGVADEPVPEHAPSDPAVQSGAATTPRPAPERLDDLSGDQAADGLQAGSGGEPLFPDVEEASGIGTATSDGTTPRPPFVPADANASDDDSVSVAGAAGSSDEPVTPEPVDQIVTETPSAAVADPASSPSDSPVPSGASGSSEEEDISDSGDAAQTDDSGDDSQDAPLHFIDPPAETPDSSEPLDFGAVITVDTQVAGDSDTAEEDDDDFVNVPEPIISEPIVIHEPPEYDPDLGPDLADDVDTFLDDAIDDDLDLP